jgi:hypothetical protein
LPENGLAARVDGDASNGPGEALVPGELSFLLDYYLRWVDIDGGIELQGVDDFFSGVAAPKLEDELGIEPDLAFGGIGLEDGLFDVVGEEGGVDEEVEEDREDGGNDDEVYGPVQGAPGERNAKAATTESQWGRGGSEAGLARGQVAPQSFNNPQRTAPLISTTPRFQWMLGQCPDWFEGGMQTFTKGFPEEARGNAVTLDRLQLSTYNACNRPS